MLSNPSLLEQSLQRGGQEASAVYVQHLDSAFTCHPDNWKPFQLDWTREVNVADAIKWGHNRQVQIDATFGSNNLKFPLFTLVVIDDFNRGIPVAWMVASREQSASPPSWLL